MKGEKYLQVLSESEMSEVCGGMDTPTIRKTFDSEGVALYTLEPTVVETIIHKTFISGFIAPYILGPGDIIEGSISSGAGAITSMTVFGLGCVGIGAGMTYVINKIKDKITG